MRRIDWIVLHTAAAYNPRTGNVVHQSLVTIRRHHIEHNGWDDIGYNRFVTESGTVWRGRPDEKVGAHVRGFNEHSLGLCVSGHGDYEAWNQAQLQAVVAQCVQWCKEHGLSADKVIGHRECDEHGAPPVNKTCPGTLIDMDDIRRRVRDEMSSQGQDLEYRVLSLEADLECRVLSLEAKLEELDRIVSRLVGDKAQS